MKIAIGLALSTIKTVGAVEALVLLDAPERIGGVSRACLPAEGENDLGWFSRNLYQINFDLFS